ncbi:hypothetical protein ACR0ST_06740 [Aliidiomarina sp. Khilg15.8]
MNLRYDHGQALAEFLVAIPLLILLLAWAIPYLQQTLHQRTASQQLGQLSLAQADLRAGQGLPLTDERYWAQHLKLHLSQTQQLQLSKHQDYPFAQALRPVDFLVNNERGLAMASDNLWQARIQSGRQREDVGQLRYFRLSDDWSPRSLAQLSQRPAAISSGELFNTPIMHTVQRVFSVLPMGRELSPRQLEFGYIDSDVVPAQALCEFSSC